MFNKVTYLVWKWQFMWNNKDVWR